MSKYQIRSPLTNKIIPLNDDLDVVDALIHKWKMKISDLEFSIEQMEMYKKELLEET